MSSGLGGFLFGNIDEDGKLDNEDFDEELRANLTTFSERIQDKKLLLLEGFTTDHIINDLNPLEHSQSITNNLSIEKKENKNIVHHLPEAVDFEDITELADTLGEKDQNDENENVSSSDLRNINSNRNNTNINMNNINNNNNNNNGIIDNLIEPLTITINNLKTPSIAPKFDSRQILKFTRLSAKPSLLNATGRSYSRYAILRKFRIKKKHLNGKGSNLSMNSSSSSSSLDNQVEFFLTRSGPSLSIPSAASARLRLSLINLSTTSATLPSLMAVSKNKRPWLQSKRFHDLEKLLQKSKEQFRNNQKHVTKPEIQCNPQYVRIPDNSHFHPLSLMDWENEIIWDESSFNENENTLNFRRNNSNSKGIFVNLSSAVQSNIPMTAASNSSLNQPGTPSNLANASGTSLSSILSSLSLSNGALGGDSASSSATATALLALIRNQQMRSASISSGSLTQRPSSVGPPIGHLSRSSSSSSVVSTIKLKFPTAPAARILNCEFDSGTWSNSIIWDIEDTDPSKLTTHLILPLDDPNLIFTPLPVENLSKKLGRAEKIIAKRLKKLRTNDSSISNAAAITSFSKPIMDKFNLSNDKYYEINGDLENNNANSTGGNINIINNNTSNNNNANSSTSSTSHRQSGKSVLDQTVTGVKTSISRSSVSAAFLGLNNSVPALQHSIPALKLSPPAFQTCRTKRELRLWHRPRFNFPSNFCISSWLKVKFPSGIKKANHLKLTETSGNVLLSLSCNPSGGIIRSVKKLTLKDSSRFVLLEYSEEFPPLLINSGMGAYIVLYYRKKSPQDTFVPRSTFALVQVLDFTDPSPFWMFGDIPAGCTRYALCNGLFRAPLFQHRSPVSDFLVCRHGDTQTDSSVGDSINQPQFYLRPLESAPVMLVGQEFPLVEVPGPHSRRHNLFCRQRLQVAAYRLFNKDHMFPESSHVRKRLKIGRLLTMFPQFSEGSIRKWLKDYAESTRAGKDSGVWLLKEDAPQLEEDELRVLVSPESICQYESMMAEQQRLSDADVILYDPFNISQTSETEESVVEPSNEDVKHVKIRCKEIEEMTAAAPWNTTANFINAVQGRATLKLRGLGDPSGRGESFSFVKAPGEKGTSCAAANSAGSEYRQDISRIWESHINSLSNGVISTSTSTSLHRQTKLNIPILPENCTLKISRRFGADQWISEEITDPLVIRAYLRVRQQSASAALAEKKSRRGFVAPDALPVLSASDAMPLNNTNNSSNKDAKNKKLVKKKKSPVKSSVHFKNDVIDLHLNNSVENVNVKSNIQIKCGTCGQVGHMRTNRICPLFPNESSSLIAASNHNSNNLLDMGQLKLKLKFTNPSIPTTYTSTPTIPILSSTSISSNESIYPSPVLLPIHHRPKGPPIEPINSNRKRPRRKMTPKLLHAQFLSAQSVQVRNKLASLSTFLISIVDKLIMLTTTLAFHKPVSKKLYPLYYKLIKSPIDLSTIRTKAVALSYKSSNDLIDDFKLLLSNCETFNGKDSPLTDVARDMLTRVEDLVNTSEIKEVDDFLFKNIVNIDNNNKNVQKEFSISIQGENENVSILTDQEEEEEEHGENENIIENVVENVVENIVENKNENFVENVNKKTSDNVLENDIENVIENVDTHAQISEVLENHKIEIQKNCDLDVNMNN